MPVLCYRRRPAQPDVVDDGAAPGEDVVAAAVGRLMELHRPGTSPLPVRSADIADSAVGAVLIAGHVVTTAQLSANSVTDAKLREGDSGAG